MVNIVERIDDLVGVKNAIISVSNKSGLDVFVPALVEAVPGLNIYSTGGTYDRIEEILGDMSEHHLIRVSDYTRQPEMQGGLVKTLDFKIYLGLLSETYNEAHQADLKRAEAVEFDLMVVNLYPFKQTVSRPNVTLEEARANIDIGGPCMVRASAKNFHRVAIVVDPADYPKIVDELKDNGGSTTLKTRFELAKKAFEHTAEYDGAISDFLSRLSDEALSCYTVV